MRKMLNQVSIQGVAYDHSLELRKTGEKAKQPNTEYIRGVLKIATDNEETNIVEVHYTYVTANNSKGVNATFTALKNFIDGTYVTRMGAQDGQEPTYLRVDSNIGVNDFYIEASRDDPELVSQKRNEGGFIHVIRKSELKGNENDRSSFKVDMVINKFIRKEADPDRGYPEKAIIGGVVFNFRNEILPVEFSILNPDAMNYFENQNISSNNVFFTQVWGNQISTTFVRRIETETAWGGIKVEESEQSRRDWVITDAISTPYMFDEEGVLTAEELAKAVANRNVYLAEVKSRYEEYKEQKAQGVVSSGAASSDTVKIKSGKEFKF